MRRYALVGSYSAVRRFLRKLDPVMRVAFDPSEAAQAYFGRGPPVPDPKSAELRRTWVFVMTLSSSRHQYAEVV